MITTTHAVGSVTLFLRDGVMLGALVIGETDSLLLGDSKFAELPTREVGKKARRIAITLSDDPAEQAQIHQEIDDLLHPEPPEGTQFYGTKKPSNTRR